MKDQLNEIEMNLIEARISTTILYFAIHGLNKLDLIDSKQTFVFQTIIDSVFEKINNINEITTLLKAKSNENK